MLLGCKFTCFFYYKRQQKHKNICFKVRDKNGDQRLSILRRRDRRVATQHSNQVPNDGGDAQDQEHGGRGILEEAKQPVIHEDHGLIKGLPHQSLLESRFG